MPTPERPAEFAVLGLLYLAEEGRHGYDLARSFAPDQPLGEVLRLEPGMLYHHLKRLERGALVSSTTAQEGSRPPKQIYQITEPGRQRLRRWLQSPVGHTREIRLEFLIKLFFAARLDPELANRLVRTQRTTLTERLQAIEEQIANPDTDSEHDAFLQSVLQLRLAQTATAITWLESLEPEQNTRHNAERRSVGMQ